MAGSRQTTNRWARPVPVSQHHLPTQPLPEPIQPHDEFHRLLDEVQAGDGDASRRLLELYGPFVVRAVRRTLDRSIRSKFDSADFAQAVWASFYARLDWAGKFADPQALIGFLTTMARNKVVDENRRRLNGRKHNVKLEQPLPHEDHPCLRAREPTASQVAVASELWDRIIASQPAHYQAILRLRRDGLSKPQIARQLGISEKTVDRLIRRVFEEHV